jgi:hypothetical protein
MPDSMHADTNQCQAELEELNALAAVIDQANGKANAAVGTLEEQSASAQRAFWNAFKSSRVRGELGHVGECTARNCCAVFPPRLIAPHCASPNRRIVFRLA